MRLFGVFGVGGYGREVMPLANSSVEQNGTDGKAVFVDDSAPTQMVNGHPVLSFDEFVSTSADSKEIVIAIGSSMVREKIADRCAEYGIAEGTLVSANAILMEDVECKSGMILSPFVTITSNVLIGRHFHANLYSYVAHDCIIGDFVTFAPQVKCNGNVVIEDHAYVGTGAILKQGTSDRPLRIGRGAVVGMGAVVTKDVQPGETVIGNPARPMAPRNS